MYERSYCSGGCSFPAQRLTSPYIRLMPFSPFGFRVLISSASPRVSYQDHQVRPDLACDLFSHHLLDCAFAELTFTSTHTFVLTGDPCYSRVTWSVGFSIQWDARIGGLLFPTRFFIAISRFGAIDPHRPIYRHGISRPFLSKIYCQICRYHFMSHFI